MFDLTCLFATRTLSCAQVLLVPVGFPLFLAQKASRRGEAGSKLGSCRNQVKNLKTCLDNDDEDMLNEPSYCMFHAINAQKNTPRPITHFFTHELS